MYKSILRVRVVIGICTELSYSFYFPHTLYFTSYVALAAAAAAVCSLEEGVGGLAKDEESWKVEGPLPGSPLIVFVNSKSGDGHGERFLRRFKQILNPAQVFDLSAGGPNLG